MDPASLLASSILDSIFGTPVAPVQPLPVTQRKSDTSKTSLVTTFSSQPQAIQTASSSSSQQPFTETHDTSTPSFTQLSIKLSNNSISLATTGSSSFSSPTPAPPSSSVSLSETPVSPVTTSVITSTVTSTSTSSSTPASTSPSPTAPSAHLYSGLVSAILGGVVGLLLILLLLGFFLKRRHRPASMSTLRDTATERWRVFNPMLRPRAPITTPFFSPETDNATARIPTSPNEKQDPALCSSPSLSTQPSPNPGRYSSTTRDSRKIQGLDSLTQKSTGSMDNVFYNDLEGNSDRFSFVQSKVSEDRLPLYEGQQAELPHGPVVREEEGETQNTDQRTLTNFRYSASTLPLYQEQT